MLVIIDDRHHLIDIHQCITILVHSSNKATSDDTARIVPNQPNTIDYWTSSLFPSPPTCTSTIVDHTRNASVINISNNPDTLLLRYIFTPLSRPQLNPTFHLVFRPDIDACNPIPSRHHPFLCRPLQHLCPRPLAHPLKEAKHHKGTNSLQQLSGASLLNANANAAAEQRLTPEKT